MKPQRGLLAGARCAVLAIGACVTVAGANGGSFVTQVLAGVPLSDSDLEDHLEAQGFTDIQGLRHDGGRVVVTATRFGHTEQFTVDETTGDPVQSTDDDDDDDNDD